MKCQIDHKWLSSTAIKLVPRIIVFIYILNFIIRYALKLPLPIGYIDFLTTWQAASFALVGKPALAYDAIRFNQALTQVAGVELNAPWLYPPIYLLIVYPLALLPYHSSCIGFLLLTMAGYWTAVRRIAHHPMAIWLALAFPGALMNINYGQNGLFSTALFGWGFILLGSHPVWAGIVLGFLVYKPNFFILIPLALVAGRYWRTLGVTIISVFVLAFISSLIFGWETWFAYWQHTRTVPMSALEQGIVALSTMPTIFASIIMIGGSITTAYILQGAMIVLSAILVIWVWFTETNMAIRISVLTLGSLLSTPYGCEYELARLAIPLAWVGWEACNKGWKTSDRIFIILGWITPFVSRLCTINNVTLVTPLILMFLLFFILTTTQSSIVIFKKLTKNI